MRPSLGVLHPTTASRVIAACVQARWLVESYPFSPDSLSLCNVLGARPPCAVADTRAGCLKLPLL